MSLLEQNEARARALVEKKCDCFKPRIAIGTEVYLIKFGISNKGQKIRYLSEEKYKVIDVNISVRFGQEDYYLIVVGSTCQCGTVEASGNLVWTTKENALAVIKDLDSRLPLNGYPSQK